MKLQKIIKRLQKLHPKEIDLSLDRTKNLCQKLGNPQNQINCISIIGTNGKYSTIQALYAILKEAKYKCNIYTCLLYTSPSPRDGLLSRMPSSA